MTNLCTSPFPFPLHPRAPDSSSQNPFDCNRRSIRPHLVPHYYWTECTRSRQGHYHKFGALRRLHRYHQDHIPRIRSTYDIEVRAQGHCGEIPRHHNQQQIQGSSGRQESGYRSRSLLQSGRPCLPPMCGARDPVRVHKEGLGSSQGE